jgi:hypothetical protein
MQNALNVEQARLRGLVARRRDGLFSDWSSIRNVYRRTGEKRQHAIVACLVAYSHFRQGREPRKDNRNRKSWKFRHKGFRVLRVSGFGFRV